MTVLAAFFPVQVPGVAASRDSVHVLLLSSEKPSLGVRLAKAFAQVALPLRRMSRACPQCGVFRNLDMDTFILPEMA